MDNFDLRKYLAEGRLFEELTWYIEDENSEVFYNNDEYVKEVSRKIKELFPDISDEDLEKVIDMTGEQYAREEDFHGDNLPVSWFVTAAEDIYQVNFLDLAEGKLLKEELKGDVLQSVAQDIAVKNGMEFKIVDGIGPKTEDNVNKVLGAPSKARNEEFKVPHLILSKQGDNAYYLFMFGVKGSDNLLNKVWSAFGEKWETYAPGTNNIAKNDKLTHGRGIGNGTYSAETGEPVKPGDQTDNDPVVLFVTKYIKG